MKKVSLLATLICLFLFTALQAQNESEGYQFTNVKEIKTTSVKNQNRSGTCWSFSGISFLENELIRMGKGEYDLSEMWIVNYTYQDKADLYVRMHGISNFGAGAALIDVFDVVRKYGIVPEDAYKGLEYGEKMHIHGELDAILKGYLDAVVANKNKKITPVWKKGYNAVLSAYLGEIPETFNYNGVNYTPESFTKSLGLNMDDYISITSFSHHPFYEQFTIEVPDNWTMSKSYNLPVEEMMQVMNYAIDNGYSIAWASDVSDKGFNWRKGVAIIPEKEFESEEGSDRARWEKLSQNDKEKELYSFDKPGKEKVITQEMRQEGYDNYTITDDHGMVITGKATDQNGNPYFIVKNSWGESNPYNGFFYASEPFVALQTINIMLHKDAIPKDIKKKMGIK